MYFRKSTNIPDQNMSIELTNSKLQIEELQQQNMALKAIITKIK